MDAKNLDFLEDLLSKSERYSDLKITCEGYEFKVSKAFVCPQSPVIAAACEGGFKESFTNTIDIQEFDVETVSKLISFMYTGQYEYEKTIEDEDFDPLLKQIYVYSIADYYQVAKLKEKAKHDLTNIVNEEMSLRAFPKAVDLVYEITQSKKLRNLVLSAAKEYLSNRVNLKKYKEAETMAGFEAECSEYMFNCCNRLSVLYFLPHDTSPERPRKRRRSPS